MKINSKTRRVGSGSVTAAVVLALYTATSAGVADAVIFKSDKVKVYGDFRTRLEADFDSQRANGVARDDRNRLRIRARLGLDYMPDDMLKFGLRLRTGSDDSHQSPHITVVDFDDNDTGDADVNFDKWYLKAKKGGGWGWVGRNSIPFWKQNEMVLDDDVTPAGVGAGFKTDAGGGKLAFNVGYFSMPVGMQEFSGNMGLGQVVYSGKAGNSGLTLAGGVLAFDGDPNDADGAALLRGNGSRDYTVWVGSAQLKTKTGGGLPLTFGADIISNDENYPATQANANETDGFVLSAKAGKLKDKGDWLGAYYYAEIEALAVNSSYAQDDWVRWGSAVETRASDMKGHELRLAYVPRKNMNIVARLYLTESITTIEDGNRFRIDWNVKF